MSKRVDLIRTFYSGTDEDSRLERSRHGQLEYATTLHDIRRYAKPGCRVLEIGAGTGRYAIALAKAGYEVTALELVAHNLDILRANAVGSAPSERLSGGRAGFVPLCR